jgi:hypothetical protein
MGLEFRKGTECDGHMLQELFRVLSLPAFSNVRRDGNRGSL